MRWAGNVAYMEGKNNAYRILLEKLEGKRPLERPRHKLEDNIKMNLRGIGWSDMDWIHLAQDRDQWRARTKHVKNASLRVLLLHHLFNEQPVIKILIQESVHL
jgi:hypothetical protein